MKKNYIKNKFFLVVSKIINYTYIIISKGIKEKTRLTIDFMKKKIKYVQLKN